MQIRRLQNKHLVVNIAGAALPPEVAPARHTWEWVEIDPTALLEPDRWAVIVGADDRVRMVRAAHLPVPGTVTLGALVGIRSPVPE